MFGSLEQGRGNIDHWVYTYDDVHIIDAYDNRPKISVISTSLFAVRTNLLEFSLAQYASICLIAEPIRVNRDVQLAKQLVTAKEKLRQLVHGFHCWQLLKVCAVGSIAEHVT